MKYGIDINVEDSTCVELNLDHTKTVKISLSCFGCVELIFAIT